MNSKVTIYGSGVMGLCVATVLQDKGFSVDILDPQTRPWSRELFLVGRRNVGSRL